MPLARGTRIGAYEVVAPIGAGGMGEVYRARDVRLNRDVAIKALPPEFAQEPERLARFEREARLLASLSHPNIAGIFGLEEAGGSRYLVLEFVEGESLADRLARGGPLSQDDALDVGRQIAAGLEAAHESGVVHRDLKPGNVMLTPAGGVKVLDFGLAKSDASDRGGSSPNLASSPTMTHAHTQAGVILGTAAYMSPEQARGKPVDKRSDIWSFGCVLYECLTGRQLFEGETVSDLIAKILQTEPDWSALPASTPARVRALLQRCLTRDPRARLRDIGEARIALAAAVSGPGGDTATADTAATGVTAPPHARRRGPPLWAALAAAAVLSATVSFVALHFGGSSTPAPVRKLDLAAPDIDQTWFIAPVLSPDGRHIAYAGKGHVWVRDLDRLAPRMVADVSEPTPICWSPDSRTIVYREKTTLMKVPAQGGDPTALCGIPATGSILGVAWGPSGTIAFSVWRGGMYRVSAAGGDASLLIDIDPATAIDYHSPSWVSNGDLMYVTHWKQPTDSSGQALPHITFFDGKKQIVVPGDFGSDEASPRMARSGELLFLRKGANAGIWAMPFDLGKRRAAGSPYLVAAGAATISLSDDGSLLYMLGERGVVTNELVWMDRTGKATEAPGPAHPGLSGLSLSPDGRRVAFQADVDGKLQIWVRDLARGTDTRLTFGDLDALAPQWFPSGTRIVYIEKQGIQGKLFSVNADGSGGQREVAPVAAQMSGMALSTTSLVIAPDGKSAVRALSENGHSRLRIGPMLSGGILGALGPLIRTQPEPDLGQPAIAPNGRLVAYVTDEPGKANVFLSRYPGGDGKWEAGADGGRAPHWAGATGELFFLAGVGGSARSLVVATVNSTEEPPLGAITKVFDVDEDLGAFDVSRDGRRFLFSREVKTNSDAARRMVLVENWRGEFEGKRGQ